MEQFEEGDMVLVHFEVRQVSQGNYHKLNSKKFGPCKVLRKTSSNAYMLELPPHFRVRPTFAMSDFYLFDGFNGETIYIEDQVEQLPKAKLYAVEDVVDIKEMVIRRCN